MTTSCATLSQLLALTNGVFDSFGSTSQGTVTFDSNPSATTTFTVTADFGALPVVAVLTAVAGSPSTNEYQIGGDTTITATNFAAAAIDAANDMSALVTATSVGNIAYLETAETGPQSEYGMVTSEAASMLLSGATLEGGNDLMQFYLDCACSQLQVDCWGDKRSCAHIYLAAHYASVAQGAGETGPVNSRQIDKLRTSYAAVGTATQLDAEFATTKWGRMYLSLRSTLLRLPIVGRATLVTMG